MSAKQLDLFGSPPKPPKQITVEEVPEERKVEAVEIQDEEMQVKVQLPEEPESALEKETKTQFDVSEIHVQMPLPVEEIGEIPKMEAEIHEIEELVSETRELVSEVEELVPETEELIPDIQEDVFEIEEEVPETEEEVPETLETIPEMEEVGSSMEHEVEMVAELHPAPDESEITEAYPSDDIVAAQADTEENMDQTISQEQGLNIPPDQALFSRQYYTMRETAAMFNVNQSLLRFWENEFDILKPKKNRKGDRYFRPEDIKNLELIYHLLKVRKFTIGGAKEYLKSKSKSRDIFDMVQRLEKLKSFLSELKSNI